jgi:hypothetical protein
MGATRKFSNSTGLYRLSMQSGLMTTIAAGSATAGHVFAFRWTSATFIACIHRIKLRWQTTTAFTAAQEMGFRIFRLTGYSAAHTGGTAATLTAPNLKKATRFPVSALADARIGAAAALTAGTHTLDAQEIGGLNFFSQATAVPDISMVETTIDAGPQLSSFLELVVNEGFIVRNELVMGAAGVGRLLVEVDWIEA